MTHVSQHHDDSIGTSVLAAPKGAVLVYQAEGGQIKVDVRLKDETVWLTKLRAVLMPMTEARSNRFPCKK